MAIVKGDGVIIKISGKAFACARSITVNMTADIAGKSTIGSGDFKEKEKVALDWNFTIEGIVYLSVDGMITAPGIYQLWLSMTPVTIDFFLTDVDGAQIIMNGNGLIVGVSTNGAVNNVSSFNITGEGTGQLEAITPLDEGLMMDADGELMEDSDDELMTDNI